tara:strand:+ start:315 stop:584 length:270 start_codon:yes stop_codon:yes gene_type:complete
MSDKHRFKEIKEQIKELLKEAIDIVPDHASARAKCYWYANISMALDNDHGYLGSSMCSMQDTVEEFDDEEEDYDHDAGRPAHMRDEDWD